MILFLQLEDRLVLGILLQLIVPDVDVPGRLVSGGDIIALLVLANLFESLDGLIIELDILEVALDA